MSKMIKVTMLVEVRPGFSIEKEREKLESFLAEVVNEDKNLKVFTADCEIVRKN